MGTAECRGLSVERRKHRLVDCSPRWVEDITGVLCYLHFDCPEGHVGCSHTIPFLPTIGDHPKAYPHPHWERRGDSFETITLTPSIRRHPTYESREAAIAKGVLPMFLDEESLYCAMHVNLVDGTFHFAGDSR